MNKSQKLRTVKLIHTLVWIFMVAVIFYVLYCGIFDKANLLTWISIGIIILEGIVLAAFSMSCPLTVMARKYSDSTKDNFDIYLPNWLQSITNRFLLPFILLD
jgi:hypothetical protein